jgi:hypothetical protein
VLLLSECFVIAVYFVVDSVRKLLDTPSYLHSLCVTPTQDDVSLLLISLDTIITVPVFDSSSSLTFYCVVSTRWYKRNYGGAGG